MLKKFILLGLFLLILPSLFACAPFRGAIASAPPDTPSVERAATADLTSGWVQTAVPFTASATPVPATASATLPPPSPTTVPVTRVPAAALKSFTSPNYRYAITYPSDWSVTFETPGTMSQAQQIERVIFKQPGYGSPNQFSTVTIEAAQNGYSTTGQCQGQIDVVPGIKGCRRSLPKGQNPAQEVMWFQSPASGPAGPYFYVQLVYDDSQYVAIFNQMLSTFKYTGGPVPPTPVADAPCTYKATFVADVTVPDNTVIAPGANFVKTWRVRNDGTCAWGKAGFTLHRLAFVGGDRLGAPAFVELPFPELRQGGTVDLSVSMVAPTQPGTYTGNWRLLDDNGPQVGVGPSGDAPLYVQIVVPGGTPVPSGWKTYTSTKNHYVVSYPGTWRINVQTTGGGVDPEYVYLRPAAAGLPAVQLLALKGAPPIKGFENCTKNLQIKGVLACSISLPKGQMPATQLLIFQKGDSYYHLAMEYEVQQQLAEFEEIVKSFRFTQ